MSHGNHWRALVPDLDAFVDTTLPAIVQEGRLIEKTGLAKPKPSYAALEHPGGMPVRALAVLWRNPVEKRATLLSAYPYLAEGLAVPLEILAINLPDDGSGSEFEATLDLLMPDGFVLTAFDPLYCIHGQEYAVGQKHEVALAALAYCLEHVENTDIVITEGPMIEMERERALREDPSADVSSITSVTVSMEELRTLIPKHGCDADAEFQSVVEAVGQCESNGVVVYSMRIFLRPKDDMKLPCILYASEIVLNGYVPKVGDSIRGVLWLQARPLIRLPDSPSWADILPTTEREADIQGMMRAWEAEPYLSGLPQGIFELAKGIVAAGWDVTRNDSVADDDSPALTLERWDEQIDLWARSWIEGEQPAAEFSSREIQRFTEQSIAHGNKAAFVTVRLRDIGSGYRFSYEGLETLEPTIGPLCPAEYVRKPDEDQPATAS